MNRLGTKDGVREVLQHPWFDGIDIEKVLEKSIESPFKPKLSKDVLDVSNFDAAFTQEEAIVSVINQAKMRKIN